MTLFRCSLQISAKNIVLSFRKTSTNLRLLTCNMLHTDTAGDNDNALACGQLLCDHQLPHLLPVAQECLRNHDDAPLPSHDAVCRRCPRDLGYKRSAD